MAKKGSTRRSPSRRSPQRSEFEREFPGGSETANQSAISIVRTYDALISLLNSTTSSSNLSSAGRQALATIEGAGGELSPTTIAQRLLVTTASITSLLDTLERRGLVERRPDPDDRRRVVVALTDAGQQAVDEFLPRIVAVQTAALARLDEDARAQLLSSLAIIRETIAELDAEAVSAAARPRSTPKRTA
jgi:DNA-binding MarR family transcriptional regulator